MKKPRKKPLKAKKRRTSIWVADELIETAKSIGSLHFHSGISATIVYCVQEIAKRELSK